VQRTCAGLEDRGLLVRVAEFRSDGSQRSNTYRLAGALLTLVAVSVDARASDLRRTPMSAVAGKPDQRKHANRNSRTEWPYRDPAAYLETRTGTLRSR
jgi:hypothetical protein